MAMRYVVYCILNMTFEPYARRLCGQSGHVTTAHRQPVHTSLCRNEASIRPNLPNDQNKDGDEYVWHF